MIFVTRLVTGRALRATVIAVGSRIHWMDPYVLVVLDVLPGGPAQVEADYPVVGLHPRGDRGECAVVDGRNARDALCSEVGCDKAEIHAHMRALDGGYVQKRCRFCLSPR